VRNTYTLASYTYEPIVNKQTALDWQCELSNINYLEGSRDESFNVDTRASTVQKASTNLDSRLEIASDGQVSTCRKLAVVSESQLRLAMTI
jgi:hypothetical protein